MSRPDLARAAPTESQAADLGRTPAPPTERKVRKPQQARSRRTRERVLEAAVECFEERGYDETTTAAIAERAGIGVGTLYAYFNDKHHILLELLDKTVVEHFSFIIQGLDPVTWRGRDPRAWARELIDAAFHGQQLRPGMQRIMWERYFKDPEFQGPFDAVRAEMHHAIERFIDGVAEEGLLRDIDRETAAYVILNAVQWNAAQAFLAGDPNAVDTVAHSVTDMVMRFVFADVD